MVAGWRENPAMANKRRGRARPQTKIKVAPLDSAVLSGGDLYIGEWIRFMGKRQGKVAEDAEVNEGYLSQLISGKGDPNPTLDKLRRVARVIGVPVGALFYPPPTREQIAQGYRAPWAS